MVCRDLWLSARLSFPYGFSVSPAPVAIDVLRLATGLVTGPWRAQTAEQPRCSLLLFLVCPLKSIRIFTTLTPPLHIPNFRHHQKFSKISAIPFASLGMETVFAAVCGLDRSIVSNIKEMEA